MLRVLSIRTFNCISDFESFSICVIRFIKTYWQFHIALGWRYYCRANCASLFPASCSKSSYELNTRYTAKPLQCLSYLLLVIRFLNCCSVVSLPNTLMVRALYISINFPGGNSTFSLLRKADIGLERCSMPPFYQG